ncbi:LytTR family DNA-binding domain-containing protein [Variovorax sp. ZS18.2.2]|uniref:LytR/AlgR family response regulator transcription factor n=1 Tax=Variovorax sp. ZS18.2.2 TaxID=2971255 RepID=UPI002150EBE5|nr:LytTR family DNA-binding domain-containing protein [Variovorax sp. ZS18.2.2]MCR6480890.1 LytTR family DNA-binding domain-containing protein [Variovorax sp. ZS18.2.2]
MRATALIADDEALPAARLARELRRCWPGLEIVDTVANGIAAVSQIKRLRPDVVFLDVEMPGHRGLEVAAIIAEDLGPDSKSPLTVFVTAHDDFAVEAFEHAAFDYVLKPIERNRLERTCARLREELRSQSVLDDALQRIDPSEPLPKLDRIQAAEGSVVHMVPIEDVLYFEAADKYIRVVTSKREHLIRSTLAELFGRLDPAEFWQVRRGTVVRAAAIVTAERQPSGTLALTLRGQTRKLIATRQFAHLFRSM